MREASRTAVFVIRLYSSHLQLPNYVTHSAGHFEEMQNKSLGGFIPLIHMLWYPGKYLLDCGHADAVVVVDDTPAMAAGIAMLDQSGRTKVGFLVVSAIKQKDLANAVGGAPQHAIIMRYMLEADQTEQGATAATWDTHEEWLLRGIPLWVLDSSRGLEGHQKVHAAEAVREQIVTEAPADDGEPVVPAPTLPSLANVKKIAKVVPTQGTAAGKGAPSSSKKPAKGQEKESDKPGDSDDDDADEETEEEDPAQVPEYWRPSRRASGQPLLTSMRVPMIRVRTSQRRKRRLLGLLVQSSSNPRVLVLSHPVVALPPLMGQVRWQEAWVPGWLRLQDQRTRKSPLTQVFCLLLQSCVREASRTRLRHECDYVPLRV